MTSDASAHLVVLAGFVPLGLSWLTLARLMTAPAAAVEPVAVPA